MDARRALAVIDRLQEFPGLGMPTEHTDIRQIVIRFGASGYIVRYAALPCGAIRIRAMKSLAAVNAIIAASG